MYTRKLVAEKRKHPHNDLISQLITIEEEGDQLSEVELRSMITLLIFAGHETTSNLIGIGALMLLDHPDQLAQLKADLSLVPSAVEELLRFNGPVMMPVPRFATDDLELAGQQIKKVAVLRAMLFLRLCVGARPPAHQQKRAEPKREKKGVSNGSFAFTRAE